MAAPRPINKTVEGETTKCAPLIEIAPNKGPTGILSAIKTSTWGVPLLCGDSKEWKGCLVMIDNAQTNKMVGRYLS